MMTISSAGNVGRADLRYTPGGDAVLGFSLAVNRGHGDKQTTVWLDCSVWGKWAESLAPHISKGTRLAISGEGGEREYQANDGSQRKSITVRVTELTFMGGGEQGGREQSQHSASARGSSPSQQAQAPAAPADFENDLPF